METKIILDKNTFEVKAYKLNTMFRGTIGGYAFNRNADYYITTEGDDLVLKSVMDDIEYTTVITDLDTEARTFKIKKKEYHYKIDQN